MWGPGASISWKDLAFFLKTFTLQAFKVPHMSGVTAMWGWQGYLFQHFMNRRGVQKCNLTLAVSPTCPVSTAQALCLIISNTFYYKSFANGQRITAMAKSESLPLSLTGIRLASYNTFGDVNYFPPFRSSPEYRLQTDYTQKAVHKSPPWTRTGGLKNGNRWTGGVLKKMNRWTHGAQSLKLWSLGVLN